VSGFSSRTSHSPPPNSSDLGEGGDEQLARRVVDLANGLLERLPRLGEVGPLARQEFLALERFLMFLDRQHVHRPEPVQLLAQRFGFAAEGFVVELDGRGFGEHVLERPAPLRLQPLANRGALPAQLGVAKLGVMQLVGQRLRAPARLAE
jgi:hypothetical protein